MKSNFNTQHLVPVLCLFAVCHTQAQAFSSGTETIFVNEIHYDNSSTDVNEAIEIAGPAGTDLAGWSLVFYNGSSTQLKVYDTVNLSGTLTDQCNGIGTLTFAKAGIQNGAPDGFALVDNNGVVQQFLSYEGSFTPIDGPAVGLLSTDIGVSEPSSTPADHSLQLSGDGTVYGDFSWAAADTATFSSLNNNQTIDGTVCGSGGTPPETPSVSKIHDIQGTGSNVNTGNYTIEAIVVGDFQGSNQLDGFFVQEEDADIDADSATSEGIFVFCGACTVDVSVGDKVEVTGDASDFFGMSQIGASGVTVISSNNTLPTPASINLPTPVSTTTDQLIADAEIDAYYEAIEGMLVTVNNTLTVDEYFQLSRFGQIVLSEGDRPQQFTDINIPSAAGLTAHNINLAARRIILDDDNNDQNSALFNNTPVFYPQPGFSSSNFFRGGATIDGLTGVLHWSWAGSGGTDAWRIRPVTELADYQFVENNPRSVMPAATGGNLKVASFNVLNYFTTIDEAGNACGPFDEGCRGADSSTELQMQTDKLVSAICAIDADVVGLIEIENNPMQSLNDLTLALNLQCGTYDFVNTGFVGDDVIKQGLIYKTATVGMVGNSAVLDTLAFTDPNNTGSTRNRPAVAQTFEDLQTGTDFTVVVNHLKSKGSSCGAGDDDATSGQGNCNLTRTLAAIEEANWLATDPTSTGATNILILGDLNAYAQEDPIMALTAAGYVDLLKVVNPNGYSYLFDGQLGTLDYAMANADLLPAVTGVTAWHINADEVNLLDYNDTVQDASEASFEAKPDSLPLFVADPYRSSDHDPIIVGLDFSITAAPDYDLDNDGCVGRTDVRALIVDIRSRSTDVDQDFNNDGKVNRADARVIINNYSFSDGNCPT